MRNVVKRIVNVPAKAASAQPQPSQPARATGPQTWLRVAGMASATRKNERITKTVMNVVSLVGKESARNNPISAGWYVRGRSRKRQIVINRAKVMAAT